MKLLQHLMYWNVLMKKGKMVIQHSVHRSSVPLKATKCHARFLTCDCRYCTATMSSFCERKLNQFKSQIDKSEQVTSFVYSLHATHNRMCAEMRGKKMLIGEQ